MSPSNTLKHAYFNLEQENGRLRKELGLLKGRHQAVLNRLNKLVEDDRWLTPKEYRTRYHLGRTKVWELEKAGQVTVRRIRLTGKVRGSVRILNRAPSASNAVQRPSSTPSATSTEPTWSQPMNRS